MLQLGRRPVVDWHAEARRAGIIGPLPEQPAIGRRFHRDCGSGSGWSPSPAESVQILRPLACQRSLNNLARAASSTKGREVRFHRTASRPFLEVADKLDARSGPEPP